MNFEHLSPGDKRLEGEWESAGEQGQESLVWIKDDLVLQERPATLLENIKKSIEILQPIKEEPEFVSCAGEIIAYKDLSFYTLWPRVWGETLRLPEDGKFHDWETLKQVLPAMDRALQKLHAISAGHQSYSVPKNPIVASRIASQDWVLSSLKAKMGVLPNLPIEPKGEPVISHGDLALHNMFYKGEKVFLFDWSNLSALPSYADAAHFVQGILIGLNHTDWPEIVRETHLLSVSLSLDKWAAAILWSLARSAAIWQSHYPNREGFLASHEKVDTFLSSF